VKPTILLATTCNWVSPARLAIALADAGFDVKAVCPAHNYLNKISRLPGTYTYSALRPVNSFLKAIEATKPDLILPCDDLATRHLHELHKRCAQTGDSKVSELLVYSLGGSQNFALLDARTPFISFARKEGIRAPRTEVITSFAELNAFLRDAEFPLVLKADGSSSGEGVAIVNSAKEAVEAFRMLQSPPKLVRTLKWMIVNHNFRPVIPTLLRRKSIVNVQSYISGRDATSLIACWHGRLLAELQFEVLSVQKAAGPASILKLTCHSEMSQTATQIADKLQLSGLYGFDFILEDATQHAHLVEMNPRTTQVGHLALGPGRDIPASLYAALMEEEVLPRPKVTNKDVIVLFPEGWLRDPTNSSLKTGYHDVPWDEPDLVRSLVDRQHGASAWLSNQKWLRRLWGPKLPRL
jgi:hypothetical protein